MKIELVSYQFAKSSWVQDTLSTYEKKINGFNAFEINLLNPNKKRTIEECIDEKGLLVLCDERGKQMDSHEFAGKMEKWLESGKQKIQFIVGGPFGVSESLKKKANESICLSSFVMNQEVAATVLLEQIYRAFTINNNHPYHNE